MNIYEDRIEFKRDGEMYALYIQDAIDYGLARKIPYYPLNCGDVYKDPTGITHNLLLIQVVDIPYSISILVNRSINAYQLIDVVWPFKGKFYDETHSLDEIEKYLIEKKMVFHKNISEDIKKLIDS